VTTRAWTDASRAIATGLARALPIAFTICAALVAPARAEASGAASTTAAPGPFSAALVAAAPEPTSATITPSLSSTRPGARGALTLKVHYSGGEHGVPAPVLRSAMSLPAGLTFDVPSLRSCSPTVLRTRGPSACPPQSLVGRGRAFGEALTGSEVVGEEATVWAFIGPPTANNPTIEVVGEGTTPVPVQVVVTGTVVPARPPYGEQIVIPIPPIPSLPGGSNASLVDLTLTLGTAAAHPPPTANTIVLPPRCPTGGYPFAAAFTYADGATGATAAKVPCPAHTGRPRGRSGAHRRRSRSAPHNRSDPNNRDDRGKNAY
jgi:hypothetical protein